VHPSWGICTLLCIKSYSIGTWGLLCLSACHCTQLLSTMQDALTAFDTPLKPCMSTPSMHLIDSAGCQHHAQAVKLAALAVGLPPKTATACPETYSAADVIVSILLEVKSYQSLGLCLENVLHILLVLQFIGAAVVDVQSNCKKSKQHTKSQKFH